MPALVCTPVVEGDVGANCGSSENAICNPDLYCDPQTAQCEHLEVSGASCEGFFPSGCAVPLSCVGDSDASTCQTGGTGAVCYNGDSDCAPGLACIQLPCADTPGAPDGGLVESCDWTCGSATWVAPGQPCDDVTTRCLVGSCLPTEDGVYRAPAGTTCPEIVADGQPANTGSTYSTCDTFAKSFNPTAPAGTPAPTGTCELYDSVVCK
jgi:hypothetical protein